MLWIKGQEPADTGPSLQPVVTLVLEGSDQSSSSAGPTPREGLCYTCSWVWLDQKNLNETEKAGGEKGNPVSSNCDSCQPAGGGI